MGGRVRETVRHGTVGAVNDTSATRVFDTRNRFLVLQDAFSMRHAGITIKTGNAYRVNSLGEKTFGLVTGGLTEYLQARRVMSKHLYGRLELNKTHLMSLGILLVLVLFHDVVNLL